MSVTKLTNSIVWIDKDRNHFSSKSVVTNRSAQTLSITPVFCDWLPTSLGLAKGTSEGEVQKEHSRCADDPESSKSVWSIFFKTCWWTPGCYPLLDYRYTLGRGGDESNILFDQKDPQYKLYKIERGGEVWSLARVYGDSGHPSLPGSARGVSDPWSELLWSGSTLIPENGIFSKNPLTACRWKRSSFVH